VVAFFFFFFFSQRLLAAYGVRFPSLHHPVRSFGRSQQALFPDSCHAVERLGLDFGGAKNRADNKARRSFKVGSDDYGVGGRKRNIVETRQKRRQEWCVAGVVRLQVCCFPVGVLGREI
jgi:hypothetical protein